MTTYTDGFVIPVPTANLERYSEMATLACQIWMEHGALDYKECILDDGATECALSFSEGLQIKSDETVIFAWIHYASREERDAVNKRVLADPRIQEMCGGDGSNMPFEAKRMLYSGFRVVVDAQANATTTTN